ncbi:MAG TPA: DUF2079 domain-containing protein [Acidimicrobiia bacterium]|nr:DUF2079 domain-containing protein [Acidimicrobiia bacterium]
MAVGTKGRETEPGFTPARPDDAGPAAPPPRPLLRLDRGSLAIAAALAVTVFLLSWYRHATFRSGTLDLAVFDQAIWKMAHLHSPYVTTIGWNAFADHLSPVLVLFVPLYWIAATPLWLFAAQGLALGAGYLALGPALDAAGTPRRATTALAIAYLSSPLLWNAGLFDFHPTTLAGPFLLAGITAALTDRRRELVLCCVAVLLLRDDLGPAVTALALIGAARPAARAGSGRRLRLGLAGLGLGWTAFGSELAKVLGSDRHWGYHYGYIASSPFVALEHPLRSAGRLAGGMWSADNLFLALAFLGPLLLLPLLKPKWVLAAGIMMLPLFASAGTQFHSPKFHYGAPILPFLLVATGAALARLPERVVSLHAPVLLIACSVLGFWIVGPPATGALTKDAPDAAGARAALKLVRPGDGVAAGTSIGSHVAERDQLLMYPYPFYNLTPQLPLTAKAREVDAKTAATIDVVILTAPREAEGQQILDGFLSSPYARDFHLEGRFADVLVYRRAGP